MHLSVRFQDSVGSAALPTTTPNGVSHGALTDRRKVDRLATTLLPDAHQWDSHAVPGRSGCGLTGPQRLLTTTLAPLIFRHYLYNTIF
jgi:hypothetical protein